MIITEKKGEYIVTYSDKYCITQGDIVCIAAYEVKPTEWEETDIPTQDTIMADLQNQLAELQQQLAAKDAELSQLKAKMVRG
jgi:hypothetical protein